MCVTIELLIEQVIRLATVALFKLDSYSPEDDKDMLTPQRIYPKDKQLPRMLQRDLETLLTQVRSWRSQNANELGAYKAMAVRNGFTCEAQPQCLGRKKLDLFKRYETDEVTYRVAIEVETSTIENGYNDLLKIMQLLKHDEIDYGVILFVQNNRTDKPKLTVKELNNNLVIALDKVLDDYRGRLFVFQIDADAAPDL